MRKITAALRINSSFFIAVLLAVPLVLSGMGAALALTPAGSAAGRPAGITPGPAPGPGALLQEFRINPLKKTLEDTGQITVTPTIHNTPFGVIRMAHEGNITTGIAAGALPYAELSAAVYDDRRQVGGWNRIDDKRNILSGFHASTYKNSAGQVAVVFEGTGKKDVRDWITDASQLAGIPSQYVQAVKYARGVIATAGSDNVVITGHSLGGGMAQYAAARLGARAYTFNPAGLGVLSFAAVKMGGQVKKADIINIITDGYIIDWDTGVIKRRGDVASKTGVVLGVFYKVPIESNGGIGGYLERHGIDNLRDALRAIVAETPGRTTGGPALTIIAVVDSSGSMAQTDPHNLRIAALDMMLDTLGADTVLGVVDFDNEARVIAPPQALGPLGGTVRQAMRRAFRKINADGGTDIRRGLMAGVGLLRGRDKGAVMVLLTDGRDESGSGWHGGAGFIPAGVVVHTIALSGQADQEALSRLSAATGGVPEIARNAGELQGIISTLFGMAEGDEVLLVRKGNIRQGETAKYMVDFEEGIGRVNFQVSWPGSDVDLIVIDPAGRRYSMAEAVAAGNGRKRGTYDIMQLKNPMPGRWQIEVYGRRIAPGGESYNLRVAARDTRVQSNWEAKPLVPEAGGQFSVSLQSQGGVTWKSAKVRIDRPDGSETTKTVSLGGLAAVLGGESGETIYSMRPMITGLYRVHVEAAGIMDDGSRVQRAFERTFRVAVPGRGVKRKHRIKPFIRSY